MAAFSDKLLEIAAPIRQSMTYGQGREMTTHKELSRRTGVAVYFCDLHSHWQRGSNENTNGLVRQYLPKGVDLSGYSHWFRAKGEEAMLSKKPRLPHDRALAKVQTLLAERRKARANGLVG